MSFTTFTLLEIQLTVSYVFQAKHGVMENQKETSCVCHSSAAEVCDGVHDGRGGLACFGGSPEGFNNPTGTLH